MNKALRYVMHLRQLSARAGLLAAVLLLASCAVLGNSYNGEEANGVVTDVDTGRPIAGATVVWSWEGRVNLGFVDSQGACLRIGVATTDESGRFRFPAWEAYSNAFPRVHNYFGRLKAVYAPGHKIESERGYGNVPRVIQIGMSATQYAGTAKRTQELLKVAQFASSCDYARHTISETARQELLSLIALLEQEAAVLPESQEKKELFHVIRFAQLEYGRHRK